MNRPAPRARPGSTAARLALAAGAALLAGCGPREPAPPPASPPVVEVATPVRADVPVYDERVGEVSGASDVEVRARVEGYLQSIDFKEGSLVRKGDLLYVIDPAQLQAALRRVEADLGSEQAGLERAQTDVSTQEATLDRVKADALAVAARAHRDQHEVERLTPLASEEAVGRRELDDAIAVRDADLAAVEAAKAAITATAAQAESARAAVGVAKARVEAARAAVEQARLPLSYTRILAPISGYVGMTLVRPGALVGRGESTLLTTVSDVSSVLVRVHASEVDYLRLRQQLGGGDGSPSDAVRLRLADGSDYPEPGTFEALDRAADPSTGTIAIQFRFANPGGVLRPGLTARVRFRTDLVKGALLVPESAVSRLQNLTDLTVVDDQDVAHVRAVTLGPRQGDRRVVASGLRPDDRVVVAGLQRARDGAKVTVRRPSAPDVARER